MLPLAYPEATPRDEVVARVKGCLSQSDERAVLLDPRHALWNLVQRVAWDRGLHPGWLLLAMQREQGLLGRDGAQAPERAWERALGVVGQHVPGTANASWDGLGAQLYMGAKTMAWLGGLGPDEAFGRKGLRPTAPRWGSLAQRLRGGLKVDLLDLAGRKAGEKWCDTAERYVQWAYTPRADRDVEAHNEGLCERFVEPYFRQRG